MSGLPIGLPLASGNGPNRSRSDRQTAAIRAGTVRVSSGASRLGQRRLAALARRLSERDKAVLGSVSELRLTTSRHLEVLHFADAATPLTAARKARRTLQRLVEAGLLRRLQRVIGGLHAGSAGYVYVITAAGQRLLDLPGSRRRVSEPSLPLVAHTLAIADLYIELIATARRDPDQGIEVLDLQTEPTCWRSWTGLGGSRELLRPDLYLAAGIGKDEVRWFVEMDLGSEHRPALVRKAAIYQRYYDSGIEQQRDGIFPKVAWIVPDERRAQQLRQALTSVSNLNQELFAVLLVTNAAEQLIT